MQVSGARQRWLELRALRLVLLRAAAIFFLLLLLLALLVPRPADDMEHLRSVRLLLRKSLPPRRVPRHPPASILDQPCSSMRTCAAAMFSSRCWGEDVPGMGNMTGERASSQAMAA